MDQFQGTPGHDVDGEKMLDRGSLSERILQPRKEIKQSIIVITTDCYMNCQKTYNLSVIFGFGILYVVQDMMTLYNRL